MVRDQQAALGDFTGGFDGGVENAQDAARGMLEPGGAFAFRGIFGEPAHAGEVNRRQGEFYEKPNQPQDYADRMPQ
jgi:hypothetical protein